MRGKHGLPKWYWDACVLLAWLHDDWAGVPGVMEGIEEMAKTINEGKAVMFTSVATKPEVLNRERVRCSRTCSNGETSRLWPKMRGSAT